jgi:hypothetical protein
MRRLALIMYSSRAVRNFVVVGMVVEVVVRCCGDDAPINGSPVSDGSASGWCLHAWFAKPLLISQSRPIPSFHMFGLYSSSSRIGFVWSYLVIKFAEYACCE